MATSSLQPPSSFYSFDELPKRNIIFETETDLQFDSDQFIIIDNELYFTEKLTNRIQIYSDNLKPMRQISLKDACQVTSISYLAPLVLISSNAYIYSCHKDGSNMKRIARGHSIYLCVNRNKLFALNIENQKVVRFDFDSHSQGFSKNKVIRLAEIGNCYNTTMQVTNDFIWIGAYNQIFREGSDETILQYNHDGVLLKNHDPRHSPFGRFLFPFSVCDQDSEGRILIADGNRRIITLSPTTGEWQVLPKMDRMYYPRYVVVCGTNLFVRGTQFWKSVDQDVRVFVAKYTIK